MLSRELQRWAGTLGVDVDTAVKIHRAASRYADSGGELLPSAERVERLSPAGWAVLWPGLYPVFRREEDNRELSLLEDEDPGPACVTSRRTTVSVDVDADDYVIEEGSRKLIHSMRMPLSWLEDDGPVYAQVDLFDILSDLADKIPGFCGSDLYGAFSATFELDELEKEGWELPQVIDYMTTIAAVSRDLRPYRCVEPCERRRSTDIYGNEIWVWPTPKVDHTCFYPFNCEGQPVDGD